MPRRGMPVVAPALVLALAACASPATPPRDGATPTDSTPPADALLLPDAPSTPVAAFAACAPVADGAPDRVVTGLAPAAGPARTLLSVFGTGFSSGDTVVFSDASGAATALTPTRAQLTELTVTLPASLAAGTYAVRVRSAQGAWSSGCAAAFVLTRGAIHHVAPTGDDGAAGTEQAPWRTVTHAASAVTSGDLVYVHAGTYTEPQIEIHASGTADAPIVFAAFPDDASAPLLDHAADASATDTLRVYGSFVVVDGLRITDHHHPGTALWVAGAPWAPDAHDVVISRCELFGAQGQGLETSGHACTVYRNDIHDNGVPTADEARFDHGIYNEGSRNVFRANFIHDNTGWGIQLYHGGAGVDTGGDTVERNVIVHNGQANQRVAPMQPSGGIVIANHHPHETIRNNVICDNAQLGVYLIDNESDARIEGNVVCFNSGVGVYLRDMGAGNTVAGNVFGGDGLAELAIPTGATADGDVFVAPAGSGAPQLGYGGMPLDLAAFQARSGQEAHARVVVDAMFRDAPGTAMGFDGASALAYDFCTPLLPAMCAPRP